ncbi:hypothetical protein FRC09_014754 [Ceratobasidium sp. 395]|nr:hypothetical protein FRC09_014754 [Ceratobasidium sp. 395]
MQTTACKVFNTPELLGLICGYSTRTSCTQIVRANKTGFLAAVSVIWNEVGDVMDLFKLFPSTIAAYPPSDTPMVSLRPTGLDFSRFKLYALHVKSVQIYSKRFFTFSNWTILNSVLHQRPFLPKLQSLVIHTWDLPRPRTLLYLGWINWFMSSSLNNVCITGKPDPDSSMSSLETAAILQALAEGCPQLARLVLPHCSSRASVVSEDMSISLGLLQTRPLKYHLAQLRGLRELQGNLLLLTSEVIPTLSNLPQLRSLSLDRVCWETIPTSVDFDPGAFSALESLALTRFEASQVGNALNLIPPLAQLTRFELDAEIDVEQNWLMATLLPRLEQMSYLTVLHLIFDTGFVLIEDDNTGPSLTSPAAISVFSKLPLEEVKLIGVIIDNSTDLVSMFPSVRRLEVPDAEIHLHMLAPFAAMSKLEYLTLELVLHEDCEPYSDTTPGSPNFHTLELSNTSDLSANTELLFQAGQTLLSIWPSMRHVIQSHPYLGSETNNTFESFQTCISLVRKARGVRARMAERYGQEEAESMFPLDFFLN